MLLKFVSSVTIICNLLNLLKIQPLPVAPLTTTLSRMSFFISPITFVNTFDPGTFKVNYFSLLVVDNFNISLNFKMFTGHNTFIDRI